MTLEMIIISYLPITILGISMLAPIFKWWIKQITS